ncbi:MAG TPA: VWA domain-containing protein [Bryobacteraceae bacterium]|nr:VWA domain-containing protein [Bryobacteraceae bacterium]
MQPHSLLALALLPFGLASAQQAAPQDQPTAEVATKEAPVKFTSKVNLVPVTVVVRGRDGKAVGTLTKEDFRLNDNGKPQVIARFSIEKPGTPVVLEKEPLELEPQPVQAKPPEAGAAASTVLADHFIAYLFDDVHTRFEDLARARDAAGRVIANSMQPADRAAIYTTSGHIMLEFTSERAELQATLARLRPAPVTGGIGHGLDCPDISYYMADRIVNLSDQQAIQVALANYIACSNNRYVTPQEVTAVAQRALHDGEHETRLTASVISQVARRLAAMPGQRNLVLASPGFFVPSADYPDITQAINRAIRANVVISTLDVRGLWTPPGFDASRPTPAGGAQVITMVNMYLEQEAVAQESVMEDLAHSTGGDWFHANNDLGDGFRRLAAAPEFIYVLAFTPENLKSDGKYHKLQVTLREVKGFTVQARKGYYAPRRESDEADQARQDIEDAVFSRAVVKDIPLELHTQFFRSGETDAKLSVVAQLGIKSLSYRKEEGRNKDTVTVVCALFDLNGNYVTGLQQLVDLKLKDETLGKRLDSGIKIKSSFDVKTGSYVVRVVARDSEGRMMAAANTAVEIQ